MVTRYRNSRDRYHGHDSPSFSSTLLDSIYRSFDDSAHESSRSSRQHGESVLFREMAVKSNVNCPERPERRSRGDGRRSRDKIVDCWMEKMDTSNEEFGNRRRPLRPEMTVGVSGHSSSDRHPARGSVKVTSSSDSSSFGGFSSSDTDSFYSAKKKSKSLKPIRTSFSEIFSDEFLYSKNRRSDDKPAKGDGSGAGRTAKSRAMKFYGDLKRMKQPISPGGKLATFLNSLFNATGNVKKQRISTSTTTGDRCDAERWEKSDSKSNHTTTSTPTCSTASSYSRSCLSKTPSSAASKHSVRFSPVSVVIDEKITASTTKSTNSKSGRVDESAFNLDQELRLRAMENNRRVEEAAMELLKNYNKKWERSAEREAEEDEGAEEEDGESCCSSDLFELENLLQIGVNRYCGELPVYETTRLDTNTNRAIAIATGFIV